MKALSFIALARTARVLFWLTLSASPLAIASPAPSALPDFKQVKAAWRASDARLLDRNGELLQEFRIDPMQRRTAWASLNDISPALIAAVLRAEDQRFFAHAGVDWLAASKAALTNTLANWRTQKPRGASTLSMQLTGLLNAQLQARGKRRDVGEKWRQMQAAQELEKRWTKTDILEAYLNLATFRGELTGIDAAARGLFDKRPVGLNDDEALILAALIRSPNAKANLVAQRVCALAPEKDCSRLRTLTFNTLSGRYPILPAANLAPHLANRIKPERLTCLHGTHRPSAANRSSATCQNTEIHTTLDANLQRQVGAALKQQLEHLAGRNVNDAAALVVDNISGDVLAYVSLSRHASVGENDGIQARRQAGSTLKPFLYGQAFERCLLTAASPLQDEALSIDTGSGQYTPHNYDQVFRGLVSARIALASSLNIPAIQTLKLVGLHPFAARLNQLGYAGLSEDADHYGYSLALGSLDVTLDEQVNAYRSLANGGQYAPLRFTTTDAAIPPRRVQSPESAFLIADILSDRQARATTFGLENPLATRYWSAVKTGTSKDLRDNWCIGFSSRYTTGVWIGNFDGSPMHDVSGISGAAPAWAEIMNTLHPSSSATRNKPTAVAGLRLKTIQPANEPPRQEWFIRGTEPSNPTWDAARTPAEISYPGKGMIFAFDPDIPAARQILRLQARARPPDATWRINDTVWKQDTWPITRGRHTLSLLDAKGNLLDTVAFEVR